MILLGGISYGPVQESSKENGRLGDHDYELKRKRRFKNHRGDFSGGREESCKGGETSCSTKKN